MTPQEPRRDIFDRVMSLPLLRLLFPFYSAHKEALLYLFFGGVTTLIDFFAFYLFESVFSLHELLANVLA
ncbi:MAG: GtrA family protein, partial [Clostridia bacterium]|nr:GtrA family protein [Clostridia bacterium]